MPGFEPRLTEAKRPWYLDGGALGGVPQSVHDDLRQMDVQAIASRTTIVLVDDDDLFRESLGQNLLDAGFTVIDCPTGQQALDYLLDGGKVDLVILDWKMPEMNGIEVLRRLRGAKIEAPAIFLTALTDQIYEEAALTTGAVDFIEKSRSFAILLKRVMLILGGPKGQAAASAAAPAAAAPVEDGNTVHHGKLALQTDTSRAFWDGRQVDLTLSEFKIVQHLAGRAGRDVSYREIYDIVRGKGFVAGTGDEGYRANVRTAVKRIRQKFRDLDDQFDQIENYPGFGYRWTA
ncbi:MAG TPA: response regulator transcription factor [Alphaproteobacteria bacterium]|nr:response regulator transcription factor [Alphaproteobacteria bacterium]